MFAFGCVCVRVSVWLCSCVFVCRNVIQLLRVSESNTIRACIPANEMFSDVWDLRRALAIAQLKIRRTRILCKIDNCICPVSTVQSLHQWFITGHVDCDSTTTVTIPHVSSKHHTQKNRDSQVLFFPPGQYIQYFT